MVENLKNENYREEFQHRLKEVRMEENGAEDLEERWNIFYRKITRLAEETLQYKTSYGKKKKQTAWWTKEVKEAVKKKMRAFRKWMRTRRVKDRQEYVEARREAEKVKNQEKKQLWERIGRNLEQDLLRTRKLIYNLAKNYRKAAAPPFYAVKDEDGEEL